MSTPHNPFPPTHGVPWGGPPPAGWGTPAWGPPPSGPRAYGDPVVHRRDGAGTAALVLGILAVVLSWTVLLGIALGGAAVVLGIVGRRRAGRREAGNGGQALAGLITGAVGCVLSLALVAGLIAVLSSSSGQRFRECATATNNSAVQRACEQQFARDLTGT